MALDTTRDLATCFNCGHDLAEGPSPNEILSDDSTFQWVKAMVWRIEAHCLGQDELQHQGVLAVLRHLIYLMLSSSQSISLNTYIATNMGAFPLNTSGTKRTLIESLPLHDRHQLIIQAAWMMDDLEARLFSAWKDRAVRYNHLLKDFRNAPEWYRTMVDKIPHGVRGGPRPQEVTDLI